MISTVDGVGSADGFKLIASDFHRQPLHRQLLVKENFTDYSLTECKSIGNGEREGYPIGNTFKCGESLLSPVTAA